MSVEQLTDVLGGTIKYDDANKTIVFLAMLTAYTEQDQLNVCLLGQSSSGKSYIAQEVAKFFPTEDVADYAGITPTALIYNNAKRDEDTGVYYVDYERKVMLFSEMPHSELLARMRPLLSHDKRELEYVATDFNGDKKGDKTRRTVVRGYPAVVFCSANARIDEQEATRCLLLSPETSVEKITAGTQLSSERNADPVGYHKRVEADPRRGLLRQRVVAIKDLHVNSVIVPDPNAVLRQFLAMSNKPMPRHPRDIAHLMSLVKAVAMLNAGLRMDSNQNIVANDSDVATAIKLWGMISESQSLGIAPAIHDFYKSCIIPLYLSKPRLAEPDPDDLGVTRKELAIYYNKLNGRLPNEDWLRKIVLPTLEANGVIAIEKSPVDRRMQIIIPLVGLDKIEPLDEAIRDDSPNDSNGNEHDEPDNGVEESFTEWVDQHDAEIDYATSDDQDTTDNSRSNQWADHDAYRPRWG
jgi:hypothetical protein